jgi:hypothetical protein
MSFDVFLQAFRDGGAGRASDGAVLEILEPLVTSRREGWARVATVDGESDVFGIDDAGSGLMFVNPQGLVIWDVMVDIAKAAGFVVMPIGCGTCIVDERIVSDLPEGIPKPVVMVRSGAELAAVARSS